MLLVRGTETTELLVLEADGRLPEEVSARPEELLGLPGGTVSLDWTLLS